MTMALNANKLAAHLVFPTLVTLPRTRDKGDVTVCVHNITSMVAGRDNPDTESLIYTRGSNAFVLFIELPLAALTLAVQTAVDKAADEFINELALAMHEVAA